MNESRAQIVATLGPASSSREVVLGMAKAGLDVARLNFAWSNEAERRAQIDVVRDVAREVGKPILFIQDLPGPRVQHGSMHTYDASSTTLLTEEDERSIAFGAACKLDYVAVSFVGGAQDIAAARAFVAKHAGAQKIIAKIERKVALENIDAIIAAADALMVARGDLANEVLLEEIPFIETMLIKKANAAGKPVIVATQMLESMVEHDAPTRAEVTDVAYAISNGADAVMLSEETATGNYPVEAVAAMERIVSAAEKHLGTMLSIHNL